MVLVEIGSPVQVVSFRWVVGCRNGKTLSLASLVWIEVRKREVKTNKTPLLGRPVEVSLEGLQISVCAAVKVSYMWVSVDSFGARLVWR